MNRKEFLARSVGLGSFLVLNGGSGASGATPEEDLQRVTREKEFIEGWLTDLLDTMGDELDEKTAIKIIEGCGRGCYRRHQFKQEISKQGKGDLDKLIDAYKKVFGGVEKVGNTVHIRFNSREHGCFCPVLKNRPSKINRLHCNCHKATHQAIFEGALGRVPKVDIVESVRRGGETCHFIVHVA